MAGRVLDTVRRADTWLRCGGIALIVVGFVLMFAGASSEPDPFLRKCMDTGFVSMVV